MAAKECVSAKNGCQLCPIFLCQVTCIDYIHNLHKIVSSNHSQAYQVTRYPMIKNSQTTPFGVSLGKWQLCFFFIKLYSNLPVPASLQSDTIESSATTKTKKELQFGTNH